MKAPVTERVPGWEKYAWLQAGFTTRLNGASTVYNHEGRGELNLGWTKEDDPAAVAENRRRLLRSVAGEGAELVTIRQAHTSIVQVIEADHGPFATEDGKATLQGDGFMTNLPGLLLGIQVADCVPVLVADARKRVVAAFHAGWRGTLARIVEHGIGTVRQHYGSRTEDLLAAIGPCIGGCCYAIGDEVKRRFENQFAYASALFSGQGQTHLNLVEANRRQLLDAGVSPEKINVLGECTACTRLNGQKKYFSHRDEHGFTGRMMGVIGVAKSV